ncbi:carboxylating nicotinate-nucleotide diphosphorylase [Pendulispora albinea]|uniref:nicotinate-nucleotide diphosphorylase (carboxylating) n=1 Tax=Pendulispora albinea TaxID=2741071 RepID=A0ABZ2LT96_9BACT
MSFELPSVVVDKIVDLALYEDLAAGDLTTEACIDPEAEAVAHAVARKELVACGGPVYRRVFQRIHPLLEVTDAVEEGTLVKPGTRLWTVQGRARAILMGERTALNLVQRMCGIATLTRTYVSALPPGSRTRIIDTRKTTPGLRVLERYAVRAGGGKNHRDNLGSAVLIKDNHVVAAGGIKEAIRRARERSPHTGKVECEVDSLDQLDEALEAGADIVLLDNMSTADVIEGVRRARGKALVEASGSITLPRITELGQAGVDAISVGALTHSAPAADIGLDFE